MPEGQKEDAAEAKPRSAKAKSAGGAGKSRYDFVEGDRYAPAPESSDHVSLKDSYHLFIGGEWVRAPRRPDAEWWNWCRRNCLRNQGFWH